MPTVAFYFITPGTLTVQRPPRRQVSGRARTADHEGLAGPGVRGRHAVQDAVGAAQLGVHLRGLGLRV